MKKELMRKREAGLAWPGSLGRLHEEMDRMFNRFFGELRPMEVVGSSVVDISEDDEHIYVNTELPGMTREDVELTIENGLLTISGEKKEHAEEQKENYYHVESRYGSFRRDLILPAEVDVDKVSAQYKDGILTVTMPKAEKAKAKRIKVQG